MKSINSCRVCQNKDLKPFFNLGVQPLANSLLKTLDEKENSYPLSLSWCPQCNLVQLNQTVSPEELFSEYIWVTATSETAREHAEDFYREVRVRSPEIKKGYVLEIASNDGTFLLPFIRHGCEVLGVDPAKNIAALAEKNGVPTKCYFFGKKSAEELLRERGSARVVFARNVLPHVANTRDFVEGLQVCLDEDGVLAIEVHYAKKILEELQYDSIYHEHLCYFTLKSIEKLLNDFHLYVYDLGRSPISGGSIIIYAKKHKTKEASIAQAFREQEIRNKTNDFDSWKNFADRATLHRKELLEILQNTVNRSEVIVGYGASARSSTLLNFCKIDSHLISVIADQNPMKHKRFTAGTHIPIDSPEAVMSQNPKCVLILAWNFADEIIQVLRNRFNYNGTVIIPLPSRPYVLRLSEDQMKN